MEQLHPEEILGNPWILWEMREDGDQGLENPNLLEGEVPELVSNAIKLDICPEIVHQEEEVVEEEVQVVREPALNAETKDT